MEWLDLGGVNWLAVVIAIVVTFAIGAVWYSPRAFFPLWARLGKLDRDELANSNMTIAFGGTLLGTGLGVVLLAVVMNGLGVEGWAAGLATGAIIGLIFRGGAHAIHNGFAARHPGITLIDIAHDTVQLAIAGAILGAF